VVAAASGGVVASVLEGPNETLVTIMVSYFMWGIGLSLSFLLFASYLYKLILFKLPGDAAMASVFLPLGPLGQGGFGFMQLAIVGRRIYPTLNFVSPMFGDYLFSECIFC